MVTDFSSATLGCMDIRAEMADSELFCQSSSRKHEVGKGRGLWEGIWLKQLTVKLNLGKKE